MRALFELILSRSRAINLILVFILVAGIYAYWAMPKESSPDVPVPLIFISVSYNGISPEDAERLLVIPMERELRSIDGIKDLRANAFEGYATVIVEFHAGFDNKKALNDVRQGVDVAKANLPKGTREPIVKEINFSMFPVLVITLSGPVPESALVRIARNLRQKVEALPQVLEATVSGDRVEEVQIVISSEAIEQYHLKQEEIFESITNNNQLVAAGAIDLGSGRITLKIPGVFKTAQELMDLPIKTHEGRVITVGDIGTLANTYKEALGFARINGRRAIALEVKKRTGQNIIQTIDAVRKIVEEERAFWPKSVEVEYLKDESKHIKEMLLELQNSMIIAVLLVMVVIIAAMGLRTAGLVGVSIPGSFFAGILALHLFGVTINVVVLFGLIMSVGMLVDGAIIVTELADRKMIDGLSPQRAYIEASERMFWPVVSSIITHIAAFVPMLFWPGMVGQFMKYLPITLIATLLASLVMSLVFVPVLGGIFGKPGVHDPELLKSLGESHHLDPSRMHGITGIYVRFLDKLLKHPVRTFLVAMALMMGVNAFYFKHNNGVQFFPKIEPEQANLLVHMRGDVSLNQIDKLLHQVELKLYDMPEFRCIYAVGFTDAGGNYAEDVKGVIQLEFIDWDKRPQATKILEEVLERTQDIYGIFVEAIKEEAGPPVGKPIVLNVASRQPEYLDAATDSVVKKLKSMSGLRAIEDSRPSDGIDWQIQVDRKEAARYGASIAGVGNLIQLAALGLKVGEYRPSDADDEVDICLRFPYAQRHLGSLEAMRIQTSSGLIPIQNFAKRVPVRKVGILHRYDEKRFIEVKADVEEGVLTHSKIEEIKQWLKHESNLNKNVEVTFRGEDEEQEEAKAFLIKAFFVAVAMITIILVIQFNSLYQAGLVLTAVAFSTVGVLLGLLITGQPFGIVMNGIGVISLAGIVVTNNIILIDTYNKCREKGMEIIDAILHTGAQRLRPVFLTAFSTVLGLLPMVFQLDVDFVNRHLSHGSPSTQWWVQLSISIAFGVAFSTLLTLLLTPVFLLLGERFFKWIGWKGAGVES